MRHAPRKNSLPSAGCALAAFMLLFLAWPAGAIAADWTLKSVFEGLAKNPPGKTRFYEQREISELDGAVESRGELEYRPPAVLIKRTLSPAPETLTLDGDTIIVEQDKFRREMLVTDMPGVGAFAASLRGFVGGRRDEVEAAFKLSLTGQQDDWKINGTPRDTGISSVVSAIQVTGNAHRLRVIEVTLSNGDSSRLTLLE